MTMIFFVLNLKFSVFYIIIYFQSVHVMYINHS